MWIEIAARNLRKNWRRSLFSVLAICIGFTAVSVFGGFTRYVFQNLAESYIYGMGNGHVTIFRKGFLEQGRIDPVSFLIDEQLQARVQSELDKLNGIEVVGRQLQIQGLVSNGEVSTIFVAQGRLVSAFYAMRNRASGISGAVNYVGKKLDDRIAYDIALSQGLSDVLGLGLATGGMVTAPTVDGYINALDFNVAQVFTGAPAGLDDKLLVVPVSFAQSLYDTSSVERINVLLGEEVDLTDFIARLQANSREAGLDVDVRGWQELSPFYGKVKDMFDVLFAFLFAIVFLIAAMSVVNTISMTVLERTREIGTLRALGADRTRILKLFVIESSLLALLGIVAGIALTLLIWWGILVSDLHWMPPQYNVHIPLEVYLVPSYLAWAALVFLTLPVVATIPPIWRAMGRGIVDALGHV